MADTVYNSFKKKIMQGADAAANDAIDLKNQTIKCALLSTAYTPDADAHVFWDDVSANEITGTGYSAGGATLASKALSTDTGDNEGVFDADNVTWSTATVSAQYAVIYKDTGTASTSPLICCFDFGSAKSSSGGDFVIQWNTEGIINLG
jgi:hypothetical protein